MDDLLTRVLSHAARAEHEKVIDLVEGTPLDRLHNKVLYHAGQAFMAKSEPAKALPYLVQGFYKAPNLKKLLQIRKIAQDAERLDVMADIVSFVIREHPDDLQLIKFLAPYLPSEFAPDEDAREDRLLAFYSLAERGRSREAAAIGKKLIAEGEQSPGLRTRLAELLLVIGEVDEAIALAGRQQEEEGASEDWRSRLSAILRPRSAGGEIMVVADVTALGDFLQRLTIACKIKSNSPSCQVTFCYRPDRGFKADLVRCAMGIDEFLPLDDLSPSAIESAIGRKRYERTLTVQTDSAFLFKTGSYWGEPWLSIPDEDVEQLEAELREAGVDPERWFVTMHYRQGSSAPTPHLDPLRDVQSGNFHDLAGYIIDELGGQSVRLGHPGMDQIPSKPSYIDLSRASIALQLFATSRSRFMIGTDSGMVSFAVAFATPTGRTNVTYDIAQENPADIILLKNLISLEGYAVSSAHQFADGGNGIALYRTPPDGPFRIFDNTPEQLKVVADRLFESTSEVRAWRTSPPPAACRPAAGTPFPMTWKRTATVLDLADMLGLPVRRL